jgi:hypothetical protein
MGGGKRTPKFFTVRTRTGRYDLDARVTRVGEKDWLVCIWGGERPHIGAVGMALPRPSLSDPHKTSSTVSVFTYPGHKEDHLVKEAAETLSAALGGNVVVCAGAHWDQLDPEGIRQVLSNSRSLVSMIMRRLRPSPGSRGSPSG